MTQLNIITAFLIVGGLAVTGTLFPAVELFADLIVSALTGEPIPADIGAKFIPAENY